MGLARMRVSLEILRQRLELPHGVHILGVENADMVVEPGVAILLLEGGAVPNVEEVVAVYSNKPSFDRFEVRK